MKKKNNPKSQHPVSGFRSPFSDQSGNFAVFFALSLTFIFTVFAFVLDTGFFLKEKNRYQACAESVALAAINNVCFVSSMSVLEGRVMEVVRGANLYLDEDQVEIETGYYDAFDQYESFPEYKDFVATGDEGFPEGESWNAVMVLINEDVDSLTGFNKTKTIKGAAVAYRPQLDLVAMGSYLRIKNKNNNYSFNNGKFYGENYVRTSGGGLNNVKLGIGDGGKIKSSYSASDIPEKPLINSGAINLEEFIEKMEKKSDTVYDLEKGTRDDFYLKYDDGGSVHCFFDFTGKREDHEIVLLHLRESYDGNPYIVYLTPYPCNNGGVSFSNYPALCKQVVGGNDNLRTSNGAAIENVTAVSDCKIIIPSYSKTSVQTGDTDFIFGGSGFNQISIISSKEITYDSGHKHIQGGHFFCDGFDFKTSKAETVPEQNFLSVFSTGLILFNTNTTTQAYNFDFNFSPPCPSMVSPLLGFLEPGSGNSREE